MTAPTTMTFGKLILEFEDPANPGTYIRPCGLTTKTFTQTVNTSEAMVPDCDDEDAPAQLQRGVVSQDWSFDGAFVIDSDDLDAWQDRIGVEVNVRISRPASGPDTGGGTSYKGYTGPAIVTKFEQTGEKGSKACTGSVTLTGAGKLTVATYTRT